MLTIDSWVGERLRPLPEKEFFSSGRTRIPENSLQSLKLFYYSVPIASGTSDAVLIVPKNEEIRKDVLVILFHGLGDDCTFPHWHWALPLTSKGFSVLSVTWDGHGANNNSMLDLASVSRTIPLLLQKLYAEPACPNFEAVREGPSCFLMGNSLGATLALIASTRPDVTRLVKGVIAVSPMVTVRSSPRLASEITDSIMPNSLIRDILPRFPLYGLSALEPTSRAIKRARSIVRMRVSVDPLEQVGAFVQEIFERRHLLRKVGVPVLWMHGARDHVVPLTKAQTLMTQIPSALFCHIDEHRNHRLMALSSDVPTYAASFVESCLDIGL